MHLIKLAWKNIIANPLQLLLNLLLFALGIGLIHFLIIFNAQLKDKFDNNLADIDLVIGAKGSPLQMILCNMYHVDNPTGNISIKEAKPFLNPDHPLFKMSLPLSCGDSYKGHRIIGTEHGILDLYQGELAEGDVWHHDFEAVIGYSVAKKLNLQMGDQFVSTHGFEEEPDFEHEHGVFTVVGLLAQSGTVLDKLILCNSSTVWAVHDHDHEEANEDHDHHHHAEQDHDNHDHHDHGDPREILLDNEDKEITAILVQYKNRTNFRSLSMPRNINANTELMAASPAYEINKLYEMMGVGTKAIRAIAILIAIVSFFSIFISLLNALKNRKYELALIRVMGAGRFKVFVMILLEGIILAIMGYLTGIAMSYLGSFIMSGWISDAFQYKFNPFYWHPVTIIILGVSVLIGILAALFPAIMAQRTDIHDTLSGH